MSSPTHARASAAPIASSTLPPLQWFDTTDALHRLRGNETLLRNLFQRLLDEHAQDHQHLEAALHKGDFAQAFQIAHNIKGIAGNLSSFRLQRTTAALESLLDALCHGNAESGTDAVEGKAIEHDTSERDTIDGLAMDQLFDAFQVAFVAAITELRAHFPDTTNTPPLGQRETPATTPDATPSTESIVGRRHKAAIKELQKAAYIGDIDEVTAALAGLPPDATEIKELQALLQLFDLDAIHALAQGWLHQLKDGT